MPENWQQLSSREAGEDNSKLEQKKTKKNSNPSIWSNKGLLQGFLGMLSPDKTSILGLAMFE